MTDLLANLLTGLARKSLSFRVVLDQSSMRLGRTLARNHCQTRSKSSKDQLIAP